MREEIIPTNGTSAEDVAYAKKVKEIYIDGVNVAGCEFLRKCVIPDNEGCKIDDSLCCDVGNCYYKQLQRLKQENEELKAAENEDLKDTIKRTVCQAECYKHKQADKYRSALEEIREFAKQQVDCYTSMKVDSTPAYEWEDVVNKINEVLK